MSLALESKEVSMNGFSWSHHDNKCWNANCTEITLSSSSSFMTQLTFDLWSGIPVQMSISGTFIIRFPGRAFHNAFLQEHCDPVRVIDYTTYRNSASTSTQSPAMHLHSFSSNRRILKDMDKEFCLSSPFLHIETKSWLASCSRHTGKHCYFERSFIWLYGQ